MAIVYVHKKPDNEVFYVGIGVARKRAKSVYGRNKHWHNVVNKFGFSVEILFDNVDYETAKDCERYLIKYYGRKDLGLGTLVNFTDGGEGPSGYIFTDAAIQKLKERPFTDEWRKKLKEAAIRRHKTKPFTKEAKEKMRQAAIRQHHG